MTRRSGYLAPAADAVRHGTALTCHDCRQVLPRLDSDSVSLTHTSPPYNIGRRYNGFRDQQDLDRYVELLKMVLSEIYRVTIPGGSVFWQVGYTTMGESRNGHMGGLLPLDSITVPIAREIGFVVWDRIVWHYYGSMAFRAKFTNNYETILWLLKPGREAAAAPTFRLDDIRERSKSYDGRNHLLGRNPGNVWYAERVAFGSIGQTSHVAVFPEEVSEKIVWACSAPGALMLDPFAGSGTLPKVALTLGRRFLGVELSETYAREADERLRLWGASEVENLAIGLMVKYGFHGRCVPKSVSSLARVVETHFLGSGRILEFTRLQESAEDILASPRVTKEVKQRKQEIWMKYDDLIDGGDEGNEVVAADRALSFCFPHRRKWNGLRRFLHAVTLLRQLEAQVTSDRSLEAFLLSSARRADRRFRVTGRSVECLSIDPGLGCNGPTGTGLRRETIGHEHQMALWDETSNR